MVLFTAHFTIIPTTFTFYCFSSYNIHIVYGKDREKRPVQMHRKKSHQSRPRKHPRAPRRVNKLKPSMHLYPPRLPLCSMTMMNCLLLQLVLHQPLQPLERLLFNLLLILHLLHSLRWVKSKMYFICTSYIELYTWDEIIVSYWNTFHLTSSLTSSFSVTNS